VSFRFTTRRRLPPWRACFTGAMVLLLLAAWSPCTALRAQQQAPQQMQEGQSSQEFDFAPQSNLARQNFDYVAGSAQEIEAVLNQQPGLLVELQDWVARDATDHGQMVDERQMSKDGIFDRLARDLKFRAVATRLLQRYGYLTPEVNPKSKMAIQQQIQFMAEEKRLEQTPSRQSSSALYHGEGQAYPSGGQSPSASPRMPRFPQNQQGPAPQQWGPVPAVPPNQPNLNNSGGQLVNLREANQNLGPQSFPNSRGADNGALRSGALRQADIGGEDSLGGGPGNMGALDGVSGYGPGRGGLSASANYPPLSTVPPGSEASRAEMEQEFQGRGAGSPGPPQGTVSRPWQSSPYYRQTGESYQQESSRPAVVHRSNPYSDIPSLYDLYEQVSPHSPKLGRFGMDVFENAPADTNELPMDLPAGPNYVVGPGDGLTINLWGGVASRMYRVVDREGRLSLPEIGPLMVSGETMSTVQQRVQQALRTQFRDVSADVSLARLRSVRVYVVGEVRYPGAYDISSLSTPLNALLAAGGPAQDGSLRMVKHYRGKQLVQNVDLYDLLLHGVRSDLDRLENGDTILVPPVGPEVTVEGTVRRPAIYELQGEETLAQVLQLAGGILPTAALRHIEVQRVVAHQKRSMLGLDIRKPEGSAEITRQLQSFAVQDGDIIRIFPIAPYNQDAVYLEGHALRPGRYSYHPGMRLGDLISSYSDLLPEPATQYAEIIRLKPPDYAPIVESFDLAAALAHPSSSPQLEPLDTVRIFSRFDFHYAPSVTVGGDVRNPGMYRTSGVVRVRDAIYQAGGVAPDAYLDSAQLVRNLPDGKLKIMSINLREALNGDPLENVLLEPRDSILVHRNPLKADPPSVYVQGEVVRPGRFPLTANLRVSDLLELAGGLKRSADRKTADLTSYNTSGPNAAKGEHQEINLEAALRGTRTQNPILKDGDVLTIKELPSWNDVGASVTIRGEVRHPGTYGIFPGDRLSSVLERAGGFLPTAYPQAAVLERPEVRKLQEKSRDELIQQVQQNATQVKVSINESAADQAALQNAALQQHKQVLEALHNAPISGRLVVHLTGNLGSFANSMDDIQVRAGDTLFVPKRPDFVVVTGQVYNSNAITFEPGRSAGWYLSRAGGVTGLGNRKAIFIVRADGSVVSGNGGVNSWWRGDVLPTRVGPGDTIVVPEKPIGGSTLWKNLIQISQVASSAAIAAAVATR
jgi:polysaccharide biosynthesis/export protein